MLMRWKRGSQLKLVNEADAPRRTREIYAEVRQRLGVPTVPKLYEAYAAFPEFLDLHWQAFRPVLESRQFFLLGARMAAECYTRAHNYFPNPKLPSINTQSGTVEPLSLTEVIDFYQYLDPLLLLIAVAQMQALEGPLGQGQAQSEPAHHPSFPVAPPVLGDEEASPDVHRIWEERRQILALAFISDEHRSLACWPGFYLEYWSALNNLLQSPLYPDSQSRIVESAWSLVRELPGRIDTEIPQLLEAGVKDEQLSALAATNAAFVQALSGLVLDITFARIGSEAATRTEARHQKPPAPELKHQKVGSPTRAA